MKIEFKSNLELKTFGPKGWKGTPQDSKGCFVNLNHPFEPDLGKLIRWQTQKNPQSNEKKADTWHLHVVDNPFPKEEQADYMVWLGHSSFFLQLAGKGFLIDPVFGNATVVQRKTSAYHPDFLKGRVDYLLLSHDHRDHCDTPSLKWVLAHNPALTLVSGLNMKPLLSSIFKQNTMVEMGWYQVIQLPGNVEIWFLPSRHWSRRGLLDTNKRLWGGFLIRNLDRSVYFMGDSGYDDHFQAIGTIFPKIDWALMGIGAYSPEWFMHPSHMSPEESWKAFQDLNAGQFFPMHYGTFDLSDEPLSEPLNRIHLAADSQKLRVGGIGEIIRF